MNHLKDFRNDPESIPPEDTGLTGSMEYDGADVQSAHHQQEINTLKIEKLGNRVTIISLILPILIGVILYFGYMDIKERMVDSDLDKRNQVERMAGQLEEKLNALDVRIAKNRYDMDKLNPTIVSRQEVFSTQLSKLQSNKADRGELKKQVNSLKGTQTKNARRIEDMGKRIQKLAAKEKKDLNALKTIIDTSMVQGRAEIQKIANVLKEDMEENMGSFNNKLELRLGLLNDSQERLDELQKSLALLDKQIKSMSRELSIQKKNQIKLLGLEKQVTKLSGALKGKLPKAAKKTVIKPKTSKPSSGKITQGTLDQ